MSALFVENSASKKRSRFKTVRFLRDRVRLNAQNALWIEHCIPTNCSCIDQFNDPLGCGLYTGAAYTPISKIFSFIFGGCGLYTGAAYTPEITVSSS